MIINVCTPSALDVADSFGLLALELSRHLARLGVYVNLFAQGSRQAGPALDAELAGIVSQPVRAAVGMVALGYPTTYASHANPLTRIGPRVGIAMFESTKIPAGWTEALNACNAVITPCTFCRDIFHAAGVTSPVTVAPLGVDPLYAYARRPAGRPFTFLAFIDRGMRKGGIQAMQAFIEAFGDDTNYHLILKGRTSKIIAEVLNPNVTLIQRDMTPAELYQLYLQADVLINPHKGEGFGLIPREFARTGGIALTTNWSGTADHIVQWGVPLAYRLVPADWSNHGRLANQDLGYWAEVDQKQLVQKLRWVASYRDWHRAMANVYSVNIERLYTWEGFAKTVLDVWEGVANGHSRAA
jgi:glycosyltransferase involved in cell wall biosynthesis